MTANCYLTSTMMVFITRFCPNFRRPFSLAALRIARFFCILLFLFSPFPALAEGIQVKFAELSLSDEVYHLNADFDISLSQGLEDALKKGVPLYFLVEFDLVRPRAYWFDDDIAQVRRHVKISYNALTRQYQLSVGLQQTPAAAPSLPTVQNFDSLAELLVELSRLRDWQVLDRSLVKKRYTYLATLRMKLDLSQLPKPLQVNAIASKNWNLDSAPHEWTLSP